METAKRKSFFAAELCLLHGRLRLERLAQARKLLHPRRRGAGGRVLRLHELAHVEMSLAGR